MSLSPQFLDELRARTTLSAVIGRDTRLIKAGREFKACCPFHNEKTPSFTVNDEKGFYHCFGCGAHGDVIRWMTDQRGLSFMDAVKELAAQAGMDVPAPDPRAAHAAEKRETLHDVMASAQAWFVERLASAEGAKAREYLKGRGFDAHTIERFGFGYAPEGRQALKAALQRFPEEKLVEAGLLIDVEEREPYDRFRGRLMLPIEDARGRVIAFGGRILDGSAKDAPKYLNSPDTPLFDKGHTLYNLHRAGPLARKSGRLIVVEGYMDVIALSAAGIGECVAPLGTALTERQIEMLWRLVETPILCFDGDAAGQRAAMRAAVRALPLLRPSHSLKIVRLPPGLDPDDLVRRDGPQALEALLARASSLIDTLWQHEVAGAPVRSPEEKAGLKARLIAHAETIAQPDIRSLYRRELLDRYSAWAFPPRDFGRARTSQPLHGRSQQRSQPRSPRGGRAALAAAVLAGLMRWPAEIARHAEALARSPGLDARLYALLDAADTADVLESERLATILAAKGFSPPTPDEYARIRYPFVVEGIDRIVAAEALAAAVAILVEEPAIDAAIAAATERQDFDEQQRLLKRKLEFKARLGQTASARAAPSEEPNSMAD